MIPTSLRWSTEVTSVEFMLFQTFISPLIFHETLCGLVLLWYMCMHIGVVCMDLGLFAYKIMFMVARMVKVIVALWCRSILVEHGLILCATVGRTYLFPYTHG